jgi:hypothetical protein
MPGLMQESIVAAGTGRASVNREVARLCRTGEFSETLDPRLSAVVERRALLTAII